MVYLIEAFDGYVLIDAGVDSRAIEDNIASIGIRPESIQALILTHCHIDHVGGAKRFEDLGAEVIAHPLDADAIESGDPVRLALDYYSVLYSPVTVTRRVDDNDVLACHPFEISVMHTPGHTPGSISLLTEIDGMKVLFGQDIHGPFNDSWGSSIPEWRRSMERLIALNADVLCEGHYGVIRPAANVREFIQGFLARAFPQRYREHCVQEDEAIQMYNGTVQGVYRKNRFCRLSLYCDVFSPSSSASRIRASRCWELSRSGTFTTTLTRRSPGPRAAGN